MRQNRRKTNYDIEEIKLASLNLQVEKQVNRRNGILLLQNSQGNLSEMSEFDDRDLRKFINRQSKIDG